MLWSKCIYWKYLVVSVRNQIDIVRYVRWRWLLIILKRFCIDNNNILIKKEMLINKTEVCAYV